MIIKIIFWISIILMFHSYLFYPLLLVFLDFFKTNRKTLNTTYDYPFVSVLMAIHNEDAVLEKKIRLLFTSDYPEDKLEVIVGSDDSNDSSNKILLDLSMEFKSLLVFNSNIREGKPATINKLAIHAKGEIILITDANVFPEKNTIKLLAGCFADPDVGLADSNLVTTGLKSDGISIQEKAYRTIEVKIKNLESNVWGTMMGPSGGFYAIKKELFEPVPRNFLVDDFYICMNILLKGKKAISNLSAMVYEDVSNNLNDEFQRKVRIAAGDYQNLNIYKRILLNPFSPVSFSFLSHKVLRWITPFLYILMLAANIILMTDSIFFFLLFILQLIFLLLPAIDIILQRFKINLIPLRYISHFIITNLALLTGFFKNLKSVGNGIWDPTKRIEYNG
jgi:cellulose synthase/poly-beta-1,6-N-acetylglucosamine synthase-like glycosyltransferase